MINSLMTIFYNNFWNINYIFNILNTRYSFNHFVRTWNINALFLNYWYFYCTDSWYSLFNYLFLLYYSWTILIYVLSNMSYCFIILIAWYFNINWNFYWNSYGNMNWTIFLYETGFLFDDIIRNHLFFVNRIWNSPIIF
jgi:hypothetical protein